MESAGAYGAAKAGSMSFDPVAFFKHPRTILRLMCWVFSIVVFSCIVNEGYINIGSERLLCVFNNNADACNYGVTVGVACFLGSVFFLVLDFYFPSMSSIKDRKRAVLLDLVFSGLACFLWFVGFCFLANQWQATSPDELPLAQGSDAARATIAFCFFSILTWVCMFMRPHCLHVQVLVCRFIVAFDYIPVFSESIKEAIDITHSSDVQR